MVLYNVPGRTVADMQPETVLRLAQVPRHRRHQGSHRRHRARRLADQAGAEGLLDLFRRRRHRGRADAARRPRQRQRHRQRRAARDARAVHGGARRRRARGRASCSCSCCALHKHLFVEPSPAPTKWALARLGRCGAALRLPITAAQPKPARRRSSRRCAKPACCERGASRAPDARALRCPRRRASRATRHSMETCRRDPFPDSRAAARGRASPAWRLLAGCSTRREPRSPATRSTTAATSDPHRRPRSAARPDPAGHATRATSRRAASSARRRSRPRHAGAPPPRPPAAATPVVAPHDAIGDVRSIERARQRALAQHAR